MLPCCSRQHEHSGSAVGGGRTLGCPNTFLVRFSVVLMTFLCACGSTRWTASDSASQAVVLAALGADYMQTRQIVANAQRNGGHLESNPVMGERGERVPVPVYFAGVAVASTAVARALPQPWRRISQVALLAVQVKAVAHNMSYGYTITW
jgi:hypothetical protein